jgi:hypothetical protein
VSNSLSPAPTYWTPERLKLHAWLTNQARPLADLYHAALIIIDNAAFPSRLRLVCHAVREIANRLPGYVVGYEIGGRVQYEQRLEEIRRLWVASGYEIDQPLAADGYDSEDTRSIPTVVVRAFDQVVKEHVAGSARPDDRAMELFKATAPEGETVPSELLRAVQNWRRAQRWFVSRAHEQSPNSSKSTDDDQLDDHFAEFEIILQTLSLGFFDTTKEIDADLYNANR